MPVPCGDALQHLLRELTPQVLGAVVRRHHDFAMAEDAVQEALLAAAMQWAQEGLPENPRGWLIQVASRRFTDQVRSEIARRRRESESATCSEEAAPQQSDFEDDTLVLLFMCCHPSLTPSSAIALTLRAVGGLTTFEIAKAFLVPETTMAQRISRAKQSIKESGIPFHMPDHREQAERLRSVLHVLYLIFNEGYTSSSGVQLQRTDLSAEAMRLTRLVRERLPQDGEVAGLLALMLLTDARRPARTGPQGELIPLDEQDRSLWDRDRITEGSALVAEALSQGSIGSYQLQAAIAAVHDEAATPEDTDWAQILSRYDLLRRLAKNPMVSLNHAIAAAMVHGPAKGLELLAELEQTGGLKGNHRLDAARAHLLERSGDQEAALAAYRLAAGRTDSVPERNYLMARAARLRERKSREGELNDA
jgi:RNA polymerase sigma factor (sigma-70 family)